VCLIVCDYETSEEEAKARFRLYSHWMDGWMDGWMNRWRTFSKTYEHGFHNIAIQSASFDFTS
jgi:hypothetical protein